MNNYTDVIEYRDDLLDYLREEKRLYEEDIKKNYALSDAEKVEVGLLVKDATIISHDEEVYEVAVTENYTKLRPGDLVSIMDNNTNKKTEATVIDNGTEVMLLKCKNELDINSSFNIEVSEFVLLDSFIKLLESMDESKPGAYFLEELAKISEPKKINRLAASQIDTEGLIPDRLNAKQREACEAIAKLPSIYCIQGPPGTGKTDVLSCIATLFSENGLEVAIISKTHQAVNNALNKIRKYDDRGFVIKIGDELKGQELVENVIFSDTYRHYTAERTTLKKKSDGRADIVGMTLQAAVINLGMMNKGFQPRVVIVDEAGQIPLTEAAILGASGAGTIVFIGDDKQMPPIYHEAQAKHELSVSIFQHLCKQYPDYETSLQETYRMNETITNVVSRNFYEPYGEYIFASDFSKHRSLILNSDNSVLSSDESVITMNASEQDLWEENNPEEANFIASLIKDSYDAGLTPADVAVITPFRRQVRLIRETVKDKIEGELPLIDTVERLQGQDVDLIIISMVTTSPAYYRSVRGFLLNRNRLNVMISRAKKKVVILKSDIIDLNII